MSYEEITSKLTDIFRDTFDDNSILLSRETNANDIDDWDSLAQINLIVSIEKEFSTKFNLFELRTLKNVGDMMDLIKKKVS